MVRAFKSYPINSLKQKYVVIPASIIFWQLCLAVKINCVLPSSTFGIKNKRRIVSTTDIADSTVVLHVCHGCLLSSLYYRLLNNIVISLAGPQLRTVRVAQILGAPMGVFGSLYSNLIQLLRCEVQISGQRPDSFHGRVMCAETWSFKLLFGPRTKLSEAIRLF